MPGPIISYRGFAEQRERDIGVSVGGGFGGQAIYTIAAIPGICHVLTLLVAHVFCSATAAPQNFDFTVSDGTSPYLFWQRMVLQNTPWASDRVTATGLHLSGAVGAAITLQFGGAGGANVAQTISLGYFEALGVS